MSETRTIKIRLTTYRLLKVLAAERGEKLMELVDRLAVGERDRESRNVATNVANDVANTTDTAS